MSATMVLLVDDDRTILHALREQVRALFAGALTCETAESVEEAREVLAELVDVERVQVILIVSDWLMPEEKGDVLLAEVRDRYPRIVRVMMTGQADSAVLERVRVEGLADALIFKPWTREELEATVRTAIQTGERSARQACNSD